MSTDSLKAFVGLEGAHLQHGETAGPLVCPECDGGRQRKAKFYVTRVEPGVLAYVCHRASCGTKGAIGEHGSPAAARAKAKKAKLKPYTGEILPLEAEDCRYLSDFYGLSSTSSRNGIMLTGRGEFLLPIFDPRGAVRGHVIRQPWDSCPHRQAKPGYPKAKSFLSKDEPLQSWYRGLKFSGRGQLVIVEDQLSAICTEVHAGVTAVALLGTTLNMRKVREIQQQRPDEVIIALDADATDVAFKMARDWGLAFPKCRVAMLEQDIKDTPSDYIPEVLGL